MLLKAGLNRSPGSLLSVHLGGHVGPGFESLDEPDQHLCHQREVGLTKVFCNKRSIRKKRQGAYFLLVTNFIE